MTSLGRLFDLVTRILNPDPPPPPVKKTKKKKRADEKREQATVVREQLREKLADDPIGATFAKRVVEIRAPEVVVPMDRYIVSAWSVAKPGHPPEQNKDAYASEQKDGAISLCMSDGVSDKSYDSRGWARLLCERFLARPAGAIKAEWLTARLKEIAGGFTAKVETQVANVDTAKKYSYLAKPRADQGSKATLLGVELSAPRANDTVQWKAFAVGDTNLFWVRDGKMIKAWPLERAEEFGIESDAVISKSPELTSWRTDGKGWVKEGDRLFVMTDALAQYALRRDEAGEPIWSALAAIDSEESFVAFVEAARANGMNADDTTMQSVVVPGGK